MNEHVTDLAPAGPLEYGVQTAFGAGAIALFLLWVFFLVLCVLLPVFVWLIWINARKLRRAAERQVELLEHFITWRQQQQRATTNRPATTPWPATAPVAEVAESPGSIAAAYQEHETQCPACHHYYSYRGATAPACPQCGG